MLRILARRRPSHATVVAYLALFVALGGTSALALSGSNTVFSDDIANDNFNSPTEGQGGLVASDLRAGSVGGSEVADSSLTGTDVFDNTIAGADITNSSLTTADIRDDTLSFGGLLSQDLAAGSVRSSEVADNSLTGTDINEGSLGTVPSSVLGGLGRSGTGDGQCDPASETFVNCDMFATLDLPRPARVLVIGSLRGETTGGATQGQGRCQLGTSSGPIPATDITVRVRDDQLEHVSIAAVTGVFPAGQHLFGIDCSESLANIAYGDANVAAVALSDQ
jgi:hypothetical protein